MGSTTCRVYSVSSKSSSTSNSLSVRPKRTCKTMNHKYVQNIEELQDQFWAHTKLIYKFLQVLYALTFPVTLSPLAGRIAGYVRRFILNLWLKIIQTLDEFQASFHDFIKTFNIESLVGNKIYSLWSSNVYQFNLYTLICT